MSELYCESPNGISGDVTICNEQSVDGRDFALVRSQRGEADAADNARRLCAAWNATKGIPTHALENGEVMELLVMLEVVTDWIERTGEPEPGTAPYNYVQKIKSMLAAWKS